MLQMGLSNAVRDALDGYGIPKVSGMSDAELRRLLSGFLRVPDEPQHDHQRAQSYADIIRAELAARRTALGDGSN
jgi:hypothetical protein